MADDQELKTEETPKEETAKGKDETPIVEGAAEETVKEEAPKEEKAKGEAAKDDAPKEKVSKAETVKAEAPKEAASQNESASKKKKKINKLSLDEINYKIEEMENAAQIHSKYYRHLQDRKNELQSQ